MAKSSKPKSNAASAKADKVQSSRIDDTADDAVEVEATPSQDAGSEVDEVKDDASKADERETTVDPATDTEDTDDTRGDEPVDPSGGSKETTEPDLPAVAPPPAPEPQSTGFAPLVLGGVIAGAIGYAVATFFPLDGGVESEEITAQLDEQAGAIAALDDRIDNMPEPDLSALEGRIGELADAIPSEVASVESSLSEQLAAFDDRLTELEKQPNADGTLSDTALAAYQQELDDLRAELNAQQESVMSAAAQAEADLAAARAEAEALEQEAVAAAEAAAARAALNRIRTAVDTGAPFEEALAELDGENVPPVLTDAASEGVATTAELAADFPATARAALAAARAEGVSDDAGGLGGFLRSQFDVRSTAPREGSGPDAVLSRAEAAVKQGRIADALAEIEALPEVARAEMTDWTARATERADVLDAIATLSETYN